MKGGEPFDPDAYPWCRGICDAWDEQETRTVWLQFSARLGKTVISQALILASLAHNPANALFGTSTETLAKQTVKLKYYPMLQECQITKRWLPPEHRRLQSRIDLLTCTIFVAWSGSATTLSDIDPRYLHANEIDKWDKNTSEEADPLYLFMERGQEIRGRKAVLEGTPTIAGVSRVNNGLKAGTNCRWYVPCPHCEHHQILRLGDGRVSGGIIWDHDPDGKSDPGIALNTARYQCEECRGEFGSEDRHFVIKRGLWVPAGQRPDKHGRLEGEPRRPGPHKSFQLSRIYSPATTFGEFAQEYLLSQRDFERRRNFRNSWQGETWELVQANLTWQEASERLTGDHQLGQVPEGGIFVTQGIDCQIDRFIFVVAAWGIGQHGWILHYGELASWQEVRELIEEQYPHADGGQPLWPVVSFVDSGFRTDQVYGFAKSMNQTRRWVLPVKGSSGASWGTYYRQQKIDPATLMPTKHQARRLDTLQLVTVNTALSQDWLHSCLFYRRADQEDTVLFPAEASEDVALWQQIINEKPDTKKNTTGHDRLYWMVVDQAIPVDYRDALRYARTAAEWYLAGRWERLRPRAGRGETPPGDAGSTEARQAPVPGERAGPVEPVPDGPVHPDARDSRRRGGPWARRMTRRR